MSGSIPMQRVCDKCKQIGKPLRGGLQVGKRVGQRNVVLFVCADCIASHYRALITEQPRYAVA
jgi:hypothetical protein